MIKIKRSRKVKDRSQINLLDQIDQSGLTDEQSSYSFYDGNKSIILMATAGSGKTHSSVHRLKYLLQKGVDPKSIIFFSFTKAAVDELKKRVGNPDVRITTIHAFCLSVLLRAGRKKEITNFYAFIDWYKNSYKPGPGSSMDDRIKFQEIISEMYENSDFIASQISSFKLQMADNIKTKMPDYFLEYQRFQKNNGARDFSDMLIEVDELFKQDKWLNLFKDKYEYIIIDEFQDTSTIQLRVLLKLNAKHYYMIGDTFQCCPAGTMVDIIRDGSLPGEHLEKIENIKVGDYVLSGRGGSLLGPKKVTNVYASQYEGDLVQVKLKGGKIITTTPEHTHFADYLIPEEELYFTYLMYKKDMGFRIGVTRSYSNNSASMGQRFGFNNRLNQETADRIWILKVSSTMVESILHEKIYSCKYGIPTMVFTCRSKKDVFSQEYINKLFSELNTFELGIKALTDFGLEFDCPHFFPKSTRRQSKAVNVGLCSDGRSRKSAHRLEVGTDVLAHVEELKKLNFPTFPNADYRGGWRYRTQGPDIGEILIKAEQVSKITGGLINQTVRLKRGNSLKLFKAAHLMKGMTMYVMNDNGNIELDVIESVSRTQYSGMVYDINVENTHNFVANGVFTHNSIYGFGGTNHKKLISMLAENREVENMSLTKNFRSDVSIVDNSNNYSELKANPKSIEAGYVDYEVIFTIKDLQNILDENEEVAVLVRTNKVIKQMEFSLLLKKYPMRYFNYITETDMNNFRAGNVHQILKRKMHDLVKVYGSEEALMEFIEKNSSSRKFITSIHKSKGREFDVCVVVNSIAPEILKANSIELPKKEFKKVSFNYDDEDREEQNIHYVAVSRPKHKLYFMLYGNP